MDFEVIFNWKTIVKVCCHFCIPRWVRWPRNTSCKRGYDLFVGHGPKISGPLGSYPIFVSMALRRPFLHAITRSSRSFQIISAPSTKSTSEAVRSPFLNRSSARCSPWFLSFLAKSRSVSCGTDPLVQLRWYWCTPHLRNCHGMTLFWRFIFGQLFYSYVQIPAKWRFRSRILVIVIFLPVIFLWMTFGCHRWQDKLLKILLSLKNYYCLIIE